MPVYLDVDAGDAICIGADTKVRVERKSGNRVRLRIDTEYKVKLERTDRAPRLDRPDPSGTAKPLPPLQRPGR